MLINMLRMPFLIVASEADNLPPGVGSEETVLTADDATALTRVLKNIIK